MNWRAAFWATAWILLIPTAIALLFVALVLQPYALFAVLVGLIWYCLYRLFAERHSASEGNEK